MAFGIVSRHRNRVREYDPDTGQYRESCVHGPINVETVPDSGVYSTPIDTTLVRTDVAKLNGFRMEVANYHYAIQTQPETGVQYPIGTVGFGGRQGEQWIVTKFARIGWVNWSTRDFTQIDAADYDEANLSRESRTMTLGPDTITGDTIGTWSDLTTTPNGGSVSMQMKIRSMGLKWEVEVDQLAREYYQTNNPNPYGTNGYLALVFDVDLAGNVDYQRAAKLFRGQDSINLDAVDLDVDDDERFEWRNNADDLLAFMPADYLIINGPRGRWNQDTSAMVPLRKRLYRQGGNAYLLVGCLASDLAGQPAGPLLFDPTYDILENAEDGGADGGDGDAEWVIATDTEYGTPYIGNMNPANDEWNDVGYIYETGVGEGDTVDTCTIEQFYQGGGSWGSVTGNWDCWAVASPDDFLNSHTHRMAGHHTPTGNTVGDSGWGDADHTSPSLVTPAKAAVDVSGFDGRIGFFLTNTNADDAGYDVGILEQGTGEDAQLTITFTPAAGGETVEKTLSDTFILAENQLRDGVFVR